MKNLFRGVILGSLLCGTLLAADTVPTVPGADQSTNPGAGTAIISNINGMVVSVDQSSRRVRVRDFTGNVVELKADAGSEVTKGTRPASFADVKAGDNVLVTYNGQDTIRKLNISEVK